MKRKLMLFCLVFLVILLIIYFNNENIDSKGYSNFSEIESNEVLGEDYSIHKEENNSEILLLSIHGGGIEPGTTEIIKELASENKYSYYSFNGIKREGNQSLHITSTRYDEPEALKMTAESIITLSFHGYDEEVSKHTYIGGRDKKLANKIKNELQIAGFSVSESPKQFAGNKKENIVNKNKQNKGVQIEISTAQRQAFFKKHDLTSKNRKNKEKEFYDYILAIEKALKNHDY